MKINFLFMSIIVLGLIVNTAFFSNLVFADEHDDEPSSDKVTICHIPPGNPGNAHTISVGSAAVSAHEAHGDYVNGSCESANLDLEINKTEKESRSSEGSQKVTICHIPPGNPGNAHTISVGSAAVSAHEAHGDYVNGSCESANLDLEINKTEKESRLTESSEKESKALERAEKLIEKLEQQIANLEERLQNLLAKYESGEYYGNISTADSVTNSYVISFDGLASSIYDKSITTEMSGELFMENQVTTKNTSKFKILSGEVIVGGAIYDVAFGKARLSSSGSTGEQSLVIVLQTIDSEENDNTIKITLGFNAPLEGEFGSPAVEFEILDNSKISGQWNLEGSGQYYL